MRKAKIVAALVAIGIVAGCSKNADHQAAGIEDVRTAVKAETAALVTSFNNHDAAGAVAHDEPGYVGMFHGMPNSIGIAADLVVTKQQVADSAARIVIGDQTSLTRATSRSTGRRTSTPLPIRNRIGPLSKMGTGFWRSGDSRICRGSSPGRWSRIPGRLRHRQPHRPETSAAVRCCQKQKGRRHKPTP